MTVSEDDLIDLAAAIYAEARGEPPEGRLAVGHVIANRARIGKESISGVVYGSIGSKIGQFSAFDPRDKTSRPAIDAAARKDDPAWLDAMSVAASVLSGRSKDPTNGATHYYADYREPPGWATDPQYIKQGKIGKHFFFAAPTTEVVGIVRRGAQSQYRREPITRTPEMQALARRKAEGIRADDRLYEGWGYQGPWNVVLPDGRLHPNIQARLEGSPPTLDDGPVTYGIPIPTPAPRGQPTDVPAGVDGGLPTIDGALVRQGLPVPTPAPRGQSPSDSGKGARVRPATAAEPMPYAPAPARTGAVRALDAIVGDIYRQFAPGAAVSGAPQGDAPPVPEPAPAAGARTGEVLSRPPTAAVPDPARRMAAGPAGLAAGGGGGELQAALAAAQMARLAAAGPERPGPAEPPAGTRAIDPRTGRIVAFDGRQWVPAR